MKIEPVSDVQALAAARTLARAFHEDPLLRFLEPNERKRHEFGTWFFGASIAYGRRWGRVLQEADGAGVAVWLTPGGTEMSLTRIARAGFLGMPLRIGVSGFRRFMRLILVMDRFHREAVDGPHWYLLALGTEPGRQGQGVGSALIEAGTREADAAKLPCYLETEAERNVAYYRKRGFEIVGQAELEGMSAWAMVRAPR